MFTDVTTAAGVALPGTLNESLAWGNLDGGDIFTEVAAATGVDHVGARIEVSTHLGTRVKEVSGGAGSGSQNSLPVEFGLGAVTLVDTVRIQWPSGHVQFLTNLAVDQFLTVVEDLLFTDGFESGDTSAWSSVVPGPLDAAAMPSQGRGR